MPNLHSQTWIVIPTYNERENLQRMLAAVTAAMPDASVLIVDDNSPDGTGDIADELAAAGSIDVLHRTEKSGLGAAYRAGFERVLEDPGCGTVFQMDCDFSHDPNDLPRLAASIDAGAQVAIGSRYARGGSTPGWKRRRRFISWLGNLYARLILGVPCKDLTGGFKAWDPEVLRRVMVESRYANGYGFQVETTYRAYRRRARIVEIPIVFRDRTAGSSKMSNAIIREALIAVLRLRLEKLGQRNRHGVDLGPSAPVSNV